MVKKLEKIIRTHIYIKWIKLLKPYIIRINIIKNYFDEKSFVDKEVKCKFFVLSPIIVFDKYLAKRLPFN
jgi:hypothetical protein